MAEKGRSEISPQKRSLKLTPILGDWTTYKPPRTLVKKIKIGLYGFDRLSEEELKQAHIIHYNFALQFCDMLRKKFHVGSELYQIDALQNTYTNFIKNFSMPVYQGKIKSSNYHDEIFVAFDMQLVNSLINASIGSADDSRSSAEISKADEIILETFFEEYFGMFYDSFKGILQSPAFEKVGFPNIFQDNSINPQATFVNFIIELSINNSVCKFIVGYNGAFLKTLIKKLNQTEKKQSLPLAKLPPSIFNLVDQPIVVTLGKTTLTMTEIKGLEVGDVVSFNRGIDSAIPIALNEGHVILGQPGKSNDKLSVKVVAIEKEKNVKIAPPTFNEPESEIAGPTTEEPQKEEEIISDEFGKIGEDFSFEEKPDETFSEEESEEDLEGSLDEDFAQEEGAEESLEGKEEIGF